MRLLLSPYPTLAPLQPYWPPSASPACRMSSQGLCTCSLCLQCSSLRTCSFIPSRSAQVLHDLGGVLDPTTVRRQPATLPLHILAVDRPSLRECHPVLTRAGTQRPVSMHYGRDPETLLSTDWVQSGVSIQPGFCVSFPAQSPDPWAVPTLGVHCLRKPEEARGGPAGRQESSESAGLERG